MRSYQLVKALLKTFSVSCSKISSIKPSSTLLRSNVASKSLKKLKLCVHSLSLAPSPALFMYVTFMPMVSLLRDTVLPACGAVQITLYDVMDPSNSISGDFSLYVRRDSLRIFSLRASDHNWSICAGALLARSTKSLTYKDSASGGMYIPLKL